SITEFWRRWHISLSTWFRDYVYFPLGGSRVDSRAKHIRNLFVVWLLTGIWHGANWTLLAWGLFYFVLLVLEKYGHLGRGWPVWAKWLFTLLMVNFAWVLFRADSLAAAGQYLQAMFGLGAGGWDDLTALYLRENWTVLAASVLFAGPLAPRLRNWAAKKDSPLLDAGYAVLAAAVFLVSAAFLIKGTYNPFIYFNF
ncbi:MAG: MBOAT family O-acyltransferase, partial [Flavonifractor plautii]